jgi:hypothetical protein
MSSFLTRAITYASQTDKYIDVQPPEVDERDLQMLYKLMDSNDDCIRTLENNRLVLKSLTAFYEDQFLRELASTSFPSDKAVEDEVREFKLRIDELSEEMKSIASRARVLSSMATSREGVVSLTSYLDGLTLGLQRLDFENPSESDELPNARPDQARARRGCRYGSLPVHCDNLLASDGCLGRYTLFSS